MFHLDSTDMNMNVLMTHFSLHPQPLASAPSVIHALKEAFVGGISQGNIEDVIYNKTN